MYLPSDLMSLFTLSSVVHTLSRELNSAVNSLLYIPKVKTKTYGLDSIRFNAQSCGIQTLNMVISKLMTIKKIT